MHPYEMATTMRERGKEKSIRLNYGSLYTVIEQLMRENFIAVREVLKEGKRPEKTVYELTPSGEMELIGWMRELVSSPVKEYPMFEAAISLLPVLPPEEVIELLEIRLGLLEKTDQRNRRRSPDLPGDEAAAPVFSGKRILQGPHSGGVQIFQGFAFGPKRDAGGLRTGWAEMRKQHLAVKAGARTKETTTEHPQHSKKERKTMNEKTVEAYRPELDPKMMRYWMRQGPKAAAFLSLFLVARLSAMGSGCLPSIPCPIA